MVPRYEPSPDFYGHIARGYDRTAASYDAVEGRNEISERVRAATLAAASQVFHPGDRILELGCGTGRDAVALARQGFHVAATDVSPEMTRLTAARAKEAGLEGRVSTRTASAAEAVELEGPFEGAYSNGAVLNLEPDLAKVGRRLATIIRPGGSAVFTAANRVSLFELAVYPLALRPRKAFRKLGPSIPIPISREGYGRTYAVRTRFLTPREFLQAFAPAFQAERIRGLQIFTPPWNFVDLARTFGPAVVPLTRLEDSLGGLPGIRSLGAIYLCVLRRETG